MRTDFRVLNITIPTFRYKCVTQSETRKNWDSADLMSHLDYFMPSAYRPVLKIKHCILRTGSVPVRPQDNIRRTPTHGDLWAGHCQQLHLLDPNQQALTLSEDASILSSVRCFHCAFAILLKATTSFVMSVCITARTEQLGSHWTDIHEI